MASRHYVPSAAVLRALSRPRPLPCPFSPLRPLRPLQPLQPLQLSRHKSKKPKKPKKPKNADLEIPEDVRRYLQAEQAKMKDKPVEYDESRGPVISFWEQDLDAGTPPRLIEDFMDPVRNAQIEKEWELEQRAMYDADFDETEYRKKQLDEMISDPSLEHFRDTFEQMKKDYDLKKKNGAVGFEDIEPEEEVNAVMKIAMHEHVQEMLDDPEYAQVNEELLDFQAKLKTWDDDKEAFEKAGDRLNAALPSVPAFQRLKAAKDEERRLTGRTHEDDLKDFFGGTVRSMAGDGEDYLDIEPIVPLLKQIKEIMHLIDGDKGVKDTADEIQALLDDDPYKIAPREIDHKDNFDVHELIAEVDAINAEMRQKKAEDDAREREWRKSDPVSTPELDALVDKLMQDPELLIKLARLKEVIAAQKDGSAPPAKPIPSAPDPDKLHPSRLTTYRERLRVAKSDPEHVAAMQRLNISLVPPFSVSPALKSLNQALELAYLGASDSVRRILWRSYIKARSVPTLLQNIPDDAWDMLWYSQTVTWETNQNRAAHLKLLMQDLESVGRDGPPTHPDTLDLD